MNGKPALQSVTMWGGALAVLAWVLPLILPRIGLTGGDATEVLHDLDLVGQVVGSALVLIGRVRASQPITSVK